MFVGSLVGKGSLVTVSMAIVFVTLFLNEVSLEVVARLGATNDGVMLVVGVVIDCCISSLGHKSHTSSRGIMRSIISDEWLHIRNRMHADNIKLYNRIHYIQ